MEIDRIIASGDSFTEGAKNVIHITSVETWPARLGNKLNVPWVNSAEGGSSNYDIALQPIQHIKDKPSDKPLFIFGFTVDHRITYFDYDLGKIKSFYTILPEEIDAVFKNSNEIKKKLNLDITLGLKNNVNFVGMCDIEKVNKDDDDPLLDGFLWQTINAINVAMNYKNLYKDAEVLWGFIHAEDTARDIRIRTCPFTNTQYKINWPHMDNCFNQYMDNFNAVQGLSDKEKNWAKKDDCHPDVVGIQKYADFFANVISKIR